MRRRNPSAIGGAIWHGRRLRTPPALILIPQTATTTAKSPPHAGGPKAENLGGAGAEPLPSQLPAQPSMCVG
jgi:hypothetical protein